MSVLACLMFRPVLGSRGGARASHCSGSLVERRLPGSGRECGTSCGCPAARGVFSDQGLNLFPLHWQMDSYPLYHRGNSSMCLPELWISQGICPEVRESNGTPLQYSCLENPRDGGAWWAAVYGVAQSWTQLRCSSSSSGSNSSSSSSSSGSSS